MIKIEEDRRFLQDQRDQRKMVMATVDIMLTQKQETSLDDKSNKKKQKCTLQ